MIPRTVPRTTFSSASARSAAVTAARDLRPQPAVAVRVAEEVDDLGDLVLDLVDARHVGERGAGSGIRLVELGPRSADSAEAAALRLTPEEPDEQADEQHGRAESDQYLLPQRRWRVRGIGVDLYAIVLQPLE
jgi:hypothetical protein